MQTYEEYLETMRAYNFHPLDRATWEAWQIHYHGTFKPSKEPEPAPQPEAQPKSK